MVFESIPVIGPIFAFIVDNLLAVLGGIGTLFLTLVTFFAKKHLIPFLKVEKRRRYARYIALIADEVTDELRLKYPEQVWAKYLDEAVDRIIEICAIDTETARRAALAALSRK